MRQVNGVVTVEVGDTVRSFDFPWASRAVEGKGACFVEGIVEAVGPIDSCPCGANHYTIRVTRQVFDGKPVVVPGDFIKCFPVVNGTRGLFGEANGVEVIKGWRKFQIGPIDIDGKKVTLA